MIPEIQKTVNEALSKTFQAALKKNRDSFVLFLVRGEWLPEYDSDQFEELNPKPTPYGIDYRMDKYRDKSREQFYVNYLNRRYRHDDFHYEGEDGIDDLTVELMIYSHVWESEKFLKDLYRLANIVSGKDFYDWQIPIADIHGRAFINDEIKDKLKANCPELFAIIDKSYASYLRDSFAHSLYDVDEHTRTIFLHCRESKNHWEHSNISFDEFQTIFLYSVELCYLMDHTIHDLRDVLIDDRETLESPIKLPNGKFLLVQGCRRVVKGEADPAFRGQIIVK